MFLDCVLLSVSFSYKFFRLYFGEKKVVYHVDDDVIRVKSSTNKILCASDSGFWMKISFGRKCSENKKYYLRGNVVSIKIPFKREMWFERKMLTDKM